MIRLVVLTRTVGVALGKDATRLQKKLHGWTLARLGKIGSFPMTTRLRQVSVREVNLL
jgi:hypothetical protein